MPTVLRIDGYRFFFWSNESNEPPHIHVEKGGGVAKWWLTPLREDSSSKFSPAQKRRIRAILMSNLGPILVRWNEHFNPNP
jgi:uncharacterized protein DUF4160